MTKRRQPFAQPRRAQSKKALSSHDAKVKPLSVAEALALPALNGPDIICRLYGGISRSWFHKLDKQGAFDFLKVERPVGPKCFSGVLIARYVCREPLFVPSFGRKRER